MNRKHDMQVTQVDKRGNPRQIVILDDAEAERFEMVEPEMLHIPQALSQAPRAVAQVKGGYVDRAQAFNITTMNLALVVGFGVLTAAAFLRGESLTLAAVLMWFMSGFLAVWLIAYILHTFVSAEGVEVINTLFFWAFVRSEQKERYRRWRMQNKDKL